MDHDNEHLPTRRSLLERLKDWEDHESWRSFVDRYWALIYHTAIKTGLTPAEAEDVVQETVISVSKTIPDFEYKESGSFKGWLLQLTRWRIQDQFRKRGHVSPQRKAKAETSTRTATVDRVPDPVDALEAVWNQEWEANLVAAAVERVKKKVDLKQYQIVDLHVLKEWPVRRVAKVLRVNPGRIYLVKHRVGKLIKQELALLREKPM